MPIIHVEMFEGRTREQREEFSKKVAEAAVQILKAPLDHTWVIFKESPKSFWSIGGKMCDQ